MFTLTLQIDIDAETPLQAALDAFYFIKEKSPGPVFIAKDNSTGQEYHVDLSEPNDMAVTPIVNTINPSNLN
jgi:hypothetical protein